jgi:predicted ribosome quality control (RQC) complex YloA/Tae2 family protein
MDIFLLHSIVDELNPILTGHRPGKIWQVGMTDLLIDFNLRDGRWLRLMTDPLRLGLYLTNRRPRSFATPPRNDTPFVALWHKYLDGARLEGIEPLGYDRVVHFNFLTEDGRERRLILSLTGRTADALLVAGRATRSILLPASQMI